MNNNFNNFNTNIDDYSDSELLELLELDILDHNTIINKIDYLNNNYFKNNKLLSEFFFSIKDRLLNINNLILDYNEDNNTIDNNSIIDNNENIIESMTNINDDYSNIDTPKIVETQTISGITELFIYYDYLHFNTIFRSFDNNNIKTNSSFELSTLVTNITEIRLSSVNIKKPFLISSSKLNNTFIIKKYDINSNNYDSNTIIIDNGYYEDISELEDYLNNKYFYNSELSDNFLKSLVFKVDKNNYKSSFDLSNNYKNNYDSSFSYFELDFVTNYTRYYSLANILGFEINNYYNSKSSLNNTIVSPYPIDNIGNNELFFCFDENQGNIIETHKLFLNNNMSVFKVLAKINTSLANKNNNYYINETFTRSTRNDNVRK